MEPIGDFIDAGDRALVRFIWHTAGQVPGTDMEFTQVATVRDGRIVLNEFFWDHSQALKAVGLHQVVKVRLPGKALPPELQEESGAKANGKIPLVETTPGRVLFNAALYSYEPADKFKVTDHTSSLARRVICTCAQSGCQSPGHPTWAPKLPGTDTALGCGSAALAGSAATNATGSSTATRPTSSVRHVPRFMAFLQPATSRATPTLKP